MTLLADKHRRHLVCTSAQDPNDPAIKTAFISGPCNVHPQRRMSCLRCKCRCCRLKRECIAAPERLSADPALPLPAPLLEVSRHLAGLPFEAEPDYAFLQRCLADLAALPPLPQVRAICSQGVLETAGSGHGG